MSDPGAAQKPVDEVREELRRLGYLSSGLDRFVLAGAGGHAPARASLGVALRVGVLSALLLGGALTLAAVGLDRGLLAAPRDLAVLAIYLGLALGAAGALVALAGGLVAAWLAQRLGRQAGPNLSRNVGLAVALVSLAYLVLWWRSHLYGESWLAQVTGLLLGAGLSLVLGRFGSLAAVAVVSAAGAAELPRASLSRRRMLPLVGLATLLFVGGVVAASYFSAARAAAPDFAVVTTGLRVRVLGVDGLERHMLEQLLGRGELPALARLTGSGARAWLAVEPEQVPAIVWTTIATGRGPEAHGIRAADPRRLAGMGAPVALDAPENPFTSALGDMADLLRLTRKQPPTAVLRAAKTFWNVASDKGLSAGVVNWWATWPADALTGHVVSDRAFFKIEKGGAPEAEVYPPEAFAVLAALPRERGGDRASAIDRFALEAARTLRARAATDLEAVYLPGLDITTMQAFGEGGFADLAGLEQRLGAVRAYYRRLDAWIDAWAASASANDVLVLVGDPGRLARRGKAAPEGLLVLAGPVVAPGAFASASQRDVAPTVLHLLGLPRSRELDGRVLEAALTPAFRAAHPVREVARYGERPASRRTESRFDRQMLEELRSLGYIQ